MKKLLALLLFTATLSAQKNMYTTHYEKGNRNQTATYQETIDYFRLLDKDFESIQLLEMGLTDCGIPLHIVIYNPDKVFDFAKMHDNKAVLFINNGIHPGEPDGIDATMMLFRDLAIGKVPAPKNTVIISIPIYNIGGALNRNSHSRANQNGPESYGFRGNERNYDLNRDFLKSDTKNARTFAQIFHKVQPDIFIDNHVSNGADYQYVFTYIATHHQKLGGDLGAFYKTEMLPKILAAMKARGIESTPYVNIHDEKPDGGFSQFMDYPRYSTGFASMFNVPGSMPETHMLKNYAERVKVTYEYMAETLAYIEQNHNRIKELRAENNSHFKAGMQYPLLWEIDSAEVTLLPFLGYEGGFKTSEVSGKPRLYYDRKKPFSKTIPYYQRYNPTLEVTIPEAYIIPQSWWNAIELLKINNIRMEPLAHDTEMEVESYRIVDYKTSKSPYEGHYPHHGTQVKATTRKVLFRKGDFVIPTNQPGVKYLLETLEPQAYDSYFNWNFFDAVLQQKEYFSAYVFEDTAAKLLKDNPKMKAEFDAKKKQDKAFADNGDAQLDWIYSQSEYYEKTHMEYPVYRKMK
ncbi:M14 family metallopeptidase [Flavobacterium sp. MFBS3-15]|uniref:M14 family metallopeptidase n=1 Tax=Flavobacterium sp. MFBS3-15 TaxID=2989816 RepID=UPI0022368B7B|nr:M14 family metallopeptidase [Flavobacterium sp. MFBS3-15]MCW4468835.1 M14 family metallopeptidase [Flavobacterium sp. MFBS3-15]